MHTLSPRSPRTYASLLALALAGCGDAGDDSASSAAATTSATQNGTTGSTGDSGDPTTGGPATSGDGTGSGTTGHDHTTDPNTTADASTGEPATTGPATTGDGTTGGGVDQLPPTDSTDALEMWLAGGSYTAWAAESQIHSSAGPHGGNVRTFVNAALFQSLTDNNAMHPEGAAVVKELYGGGMDTLIGYAVMVKVAPDSGPAGEGWYWYERINQTVYGGMTGVGLCSGCHGGGKDNILTPFPLQ